MKHERIPHLVAMTLLLVLVQLSWLETPVSASPAPSAVVLEWTLPTVLSRPYDVVVYSEQVYFTEEAGRIGCLNPSTNTLKEWTVPTTSPSLQCIAARTSAGVALLHAPEFWFAEFGADKIGCLSLATNTFREWSLPSGSKPYGVAVFGGKVYFTERGRKKIGRIDPSVPTKITEWGTGGLYNEYPFGITTDASGNVWFTDRLRKVSRLTPSTGALRTWTLPDSPTEPAHITISKDGMVWFTEYAARDRIGRLNPSTNKLTEWGVPSPTDAYSLDIVEDAMGNMYFTEHNDNQIGKLKPAGGTTRTTAVAQVAVTPTSYTTYPISKYVAPTSKYVAPKSTTVPSTSTGSLTEWTVPTSGSKPAGIFTEDGTTFYFAEWGAFAWAGNKIARFRPQYTFTEWTVPTSGGSPGGVAVYGGKVWFTEVKGNKIGCLDPIANTLKEWIVPWPYIPPALVQPEGIAVYGGKVWFTEYLGNKIGRLDPSTNTFTEWLIPTSGSNPSSIAVYDGKVWFMELSGGKIGRLDPSTNKFTEWKIPSGGPIAVYGGKVWFVEWFGNKIGRLDPSTNTLTEWTIPTSSSYPSGIAVYGGTVWFTESGLGEFGQIGRLDPSTNKFTEWLATVGTGVYDIAIYGGKVWFTEADVNKIGKLYPTGGRVTTVTPVSSICSFTAAVKTPTTKAVTPTTKTVTRTKTDVTGLVYGVLIVWPIPTAKGYPSGLAAPGGGEVWFTEYVGNKIGLLS